MTSDLKKLCSGQNEEECLDNLKSICPDKELDECVEALKRECPDLDKECVDNLTQMDYYLVGRENYNKPKGNNEE